MTGDLGTYGYLVPGIGTGGSVPRHDRFPSGFCSTNWELLPVYLPTAKIFGLKNGASAFTLKLDSWAKGHL